MNDKENAVCKWTEVLDTWYGIYYETECGEVNEFMNDGPKENGYKYCPYCGKKIELNEYKIDNN